MYLSSRAAGGGTPNDLARARAALAASGVDVLDLSDANPTRHGLTHPGVLDAVARATTRSGRYEPHPRGPLGAREALAGRYGGTPDDYVLTASTSEAYSWLLTLVADPGDCVAVPAPGYPLVEPLARLAGVRTVAYPSHYLHPHGWEMDMLALTDVLTVTQARAVVAVNPGNPTGAYIAHGERAAVVAAAQAAGAAIIADEVFGPFVLDAVSGTPVEGGETRHPVTLAGEEAVLTFTLGGLSKLLCTPQLKLGWIRVSGPPADVARASDALDTIADAYLSVGTPVALALPELLALSDESVAATRERLRTNLATARAELDGNGWRVRRCDGGWTVLVDAPPVLPRGSDLAEHLIREAHLAVHPGWFYDLSDPRALALSLLARPDSFAEGCRRLLAAI